MLQRPHHKPKKIINIRFIAILGLVLLWITITGIIVHITLFLVNISRDNRTDRFYDSDEDFSCDDLRVRFAVPGACYDATTEELVLQVRNFGEAEPSSAMINIIGTDAMMMYDNYVNISRIEPTIIRIEYSIDNKGFPTLVEIVPRFIQNLEEEHCESSKVVTRNILSC